MQRVLDTMTESAAFVRNGRLDILSGNRLDHALYSEAFADPRRPFAMCLTQFLDELGLVERGTPHATPRAARSGRSS